MRNLTDKSRSIAEPLRRSVARVFGLTAFAMWLVGFFPAASAAADPGLARGSAAHRSPTAVAQSGGFRQWNRAGASGGGKAPAKGSGTAATARKSVEIPLLYNPKVDPHPFVQVLVGSEPLLFLVDTGARGICMYSWAISYLHLNLVAGVSNENLRVNGRAGQALRFAPGLPLRILGAHHDVAEDLTAGRIVILGDNLSMDYTPPSTTGHTSRVAGIIGLDCLGGYPLQLDFAARTLTLYTDADGLPPEVKNSAVCLPMRSTNGTLFQVPLTAFTTESVAQRAAPASPPSGASASINAAPTTTLPSQMGKANDWLLVDTGGDVSCISRSALGAVAPDSRLHTRQDRVNASMDVERVVLRSLTLGDKVTEPEVEICVVETVDSSYADNLGMSFLSRFRVAIDPKRKELWLARARDYAAAKSDITGSTGLSLIRTDGRYVIDGVQASSGEQSAGLVQGDAISEIDGYRLNALRAYQVYRLLSGYRGQACCALIQEGPDQPERAIWFFHGDPYPTATAAVVGVPTSDKDDRGPVVLMKRIGAVLVRSPDGHDAWRPYEAASPPPCDAPPDCHWQRVGCRGQGSAWMLLPDTLVDPPYPGDNSAIALGRQSLSYAIPANTQIVRNPASGGMTVVYPDGFRFMVDVQGVVRTAGVKPPARSVGAAVHAVGGPR